MRIDMRKLVASLVCAVVIGTLYCNLESFLAHSAPQRKSAITVYFSPRGGCQDAVVSAIDDSKREVLVQAYSFTNKVVAQALIEAHNRGVVVKMCGDKTNINADTSQTDELAAVGIPVRLDGKHPISHSKFLVVDGSLVTTGSWNFSAQAEKNNENLLVIRSKSIATMYRENWQTHFDHSEPLSKMEDEKCQPTLFPK